MSDFTAAQTKLLLGLERAALAGRKFELESIISWVQAEYDKPEHELKTADKAVEDILTYLFFRRQAAP